MMVQVVIFPIKIFFCWKSKKWKISFSNYFLNLTLVIFQIHSRYITSFVTPCRAVSDNDYNFRMNKAGFLTSTNGFRICEVSGSR